MNPLERLELEAIPCNFGRPAPDNGDGPTARLMALERQRRLWAKDYEDSGETTAPDIAAGGVG